MAALDDLRSDLRADLYDTSEDTAAQFFDNAKLERYIRAGVRVLGLASADDVTPDKAELVLLYARHKAADAYAFFVAQEGKYEAAGGNKVDHDNLYEKYREMAKTALVEFNQLTAAQQTQRIGFVGLRRD